MEDSNVFGNFDSGENLLNIDSSDPSLLFKDYSVTCLLKQGDYVDAFLDSDEEIELDVNKLFNLACWSNLALTSVSSIKNILDLAITLSKEGDNVRHLEVLSSIDLGVYSKVCALLIDANYEGVKSLVSYRCPDSEEYNALIDAMSTFELKEEVKPSLSNLVIGGSCYSKLMGLSDATMKIYQLCYSLGKDLRFCMATKHPLSLMDYAEAVDRSLFLVKSLLETVTKFINAICHLVNSDRIVMDNRRTLSCSKLLVDHYGDVKGLITQCEKVNSNLLFAQKKSFIERNRTSLVSKQFIIKKM